MRQSDFNDRRSSTSNTRKTSYDRLADKRWRVNGIKYFSNQIKLANLKLVPEDFAGAFGQLRNSVTIASRPTVWRTQAREALLTLLEDHPELIPKHFGSDSLTIEGLRMAVVPLPWVISSLGAVPIKTVNTSELTAVEYDAIRELVQAKWTAPILEKVRNSSPIHPGDKYKASVIRRDEFDVNIGVHQRYYINFCGEGCWLCPCSNPFKIKMMQHAQEVMRCENESGRKLAVISDSVRELLRPFQDNACIERFYRSCQLEVAASAVFYGFLQELCSIHKSQEDWDRSWWSFNRLSGYGNSAPLLFETVIHDGGRPIRKRLYVIGELPTRDQASFLYTPDPDRPGSSLSEEQAAVRAMAARSYKFEVFFQTTSSIKPVRRLNILEYARNFDEVVFI